MEPSGLMDRNQLVILYQDRDFQLISPNAVRVSNSGPFDKIVFDATVREAARLKLAPCGPLMVAGRSQKQYGSAGITEMVPSPQGYQITVLASDHIGKK